LDLDKWLTGIGLGQYSSLFRSNDIDEALLRRLTAEDLRELGVASLGHRKRLLEAIAELAHSQGSPAAMLGFRAVIPEQRIPKHLAERIMLSRSALESERKQVTVLFADLKGSMELLSERDPEEARNLLDPVLERMMEAVHFYEGTVNQVMGGGIMALFGAPIAHEDHAVRACYAALRMQEALRRHAIETRRTHGVELLIRVGLNSGEVVVRSVGNDLRMDYTAVGQTTHLAARMEQLAAPGTVRLSAATMRLTEGYIEVKSLGPIPVKGLAAPAEVFELTGTGTARTRLQAAALRGLTRFVGRDAEMEHLRRVLGQAAAGRGQVVAVAGEAGVGKSRLVYEFTHSHRVRQWVVLDAPSVSYGKASSYLPVIGLLKTYCRIADGDDHREMRDKVLGRVLGLDRELEPLLPALLSLLDVPVTDPAWVALEPPQRRQRTLDAVKRLLLRESQVQPLLLVFEDLHWMDGETQALLDRLVDSLSFSRIMLLVNYRPEYEHRWGSKTSYSQLRLDALPVESAGELLSAFLGPDPTMAPLTDMLVKRGNPFFLEETLRSLIEVGALVGERGAYRLTHPMEQLQVPATVQAILSARIDRLRAEDKQLLQAASAIGKDIPYALLVAVTKLPEEALLGQLARLQEAEFLYETRFYPDLEFTFKHALTHEVTYGSLLQDRRQRLHAGIVVATEQLYGDRLSEHVERLAHHAMRGHLWDEAVRYGRQAGTRALDRSASREAFAAFEQARIALQEWPPGRQRSEQLIDLRFDQRNALVSLGEFSRLGEVAEEARALAEELGDERRLAWASGYLAMHYSILGEHERAITSGERGRDLSASIEDPVLRSVQNYYLGLALWYAGDPQRAGQAARLSAALVDDIPPRERFGLVGPPGVLARFVGALVFADLGEFSLACTGGARALQIAQAAGYPYAEVLARWSFGYAQVRRGDFPAAIKILEPGLALCRAMEIRFALPYIAAFLGFSYVWSGRALEGIGLLQEAAEANAALRINGHRPLMLSMLSEAYLAVGRIAEARQQAEQAVALADRHPALGWKLWCLKLLGDLDAEDPCHKGRADDEYQLAFSQATQLGMRPLAAHCRMALGKLHSRVGNREVAKQHLIAATTLYQEMDMSFWATTAETSVKGLG